MTPRGLEARAVLDVAAPPRGRHQFIEGMPVHVLPHARGERGRAHRGDRREARPSTCGASSRPRRSLRAMIGARPAGDGPLAAVRGLHAVEDGEQELASNGGVVRGRMREVGAGARTPSATGRAGPRACSCEPGGRPPRRIRTAPTSATAPAGGRAIDRTATAAAASATTTSRADDGLRRRTFPGSRSPAVCSVRSTREETDEARQQRRRALPRSAPGHHVLADDRPAMAAARTAPTSAMPTTPSVSVAQSDWMAFTEPAVGDEARSR